MRLVSFILLFILCWAPMVWCSPQTRNLTIDQVVYMANLLPTAFSSRVSGQCLNDSLFLLDAIGRSEKWGLKMLDASGKLSDMYINANKHVMGHYDQCLAVESSRFVGKYCTAFIQDHSLSTNTSEKPNVSLMELLRNAALFGTNTTTDFNVAEGEPTVITTRNFHQPRLALCVPSTCSAADVGVSIAHLLRIQLEGNLSFISVATEDSFCFTGFDSTPFSTSDILTGAIYSALAGVIFAGTLIEGWNVHCDFQRQKHHESKPLSSNESKLVQIILCFSLITNIRRVLSTHLPKNGGILSCVYGIRFLLMSWVVLGHSWIQGVILYNQNVEGLQQDGRKWQWQAIVNGTISVDGFFLLSGLLVSFHLLNHLEQTKGKLNLITFYFHRYIRLTPVYIAVFAFVSTLLVHSGSGPSWFNIKFTADNCRQVWWQQFMFINNFIPREADKQCMTETWFLANELQLFLISPFLIYPLWRWRRKGLIVLTLTTIVALAGNVAIFYVKNMPPTSMITRPLSMSKSLVDFWVYYYPQPWFRSPPYLVGIFLGYFLNVTQDKPIRIPKGVEVFGWLISVGTCIIVVYGLFPYTDEDLVPHIHPAVNVLYGSFHRFAWAVALSWIIYSCCRGNGGFINDFLSWPLFVPLGRLSYCTYLIHYNVIQVYYAHKRQAPYYTATEQFYTVFGNLSVSILLAVGVCLAVETPLINLEKIVLNSATLKVDYCRRVKSDNGEINQAFTIT